MAAEFDLGDAGFCGRPDQRESLEPWGESSLMPTGSALISVDTAAVDQSVLMACAARAAEAIGPAGFLQGSLTVLLAVLEPVELRQGEAFLELVRAAEDGFSGIPKPLLSCVSLGALRAG